MLAPLINSTPVCYLGNDMRLVRRPCRIWELGENRIVAVVSETDEPTLSIETAAETIRLTLEGLWKGYDVVIVEHWPTKPDSQEHYAEQFWTVGSAGASRTSSIGWKHVEAAEMRNRLAEFDSTKPTGEPLPPPPQNMRRHR